MLNFRNNDETKELAELTQKTEKECQKGQGHFVIGIKEYSTSQFYRHVSPNFTRNITSIYAATPTFQHNEHTELFFTIQIFQVKYLWGKYA